MKLPLPRNQSLRYGLYFFIFCLCSFAVLQIARWYAYRQSARELQEIVDRLDAEDPGWDWDSMQKNRKSFSDEENSYTIVGKVAAELVRINTLPNVTSDANSPILDQWYVLPEAMPWEVADFAGAYVGERTSLIELARQLENKPNGRHPVVYSADFISTLLPTVQKSRAIASFLQWDVRVNAQFGRFDDCIRDIRAIRNAGRSMGDEGFLIVMLVRAAIDSVAANCVQYMLSQGVASEAGLALLQKELLEESREPLFIQSMRGERAICLKILQYFGQKVTAGDYHLISGLMNSGGPANSKLEDLYLYFMALRYPPYAKADQAHMLREMTEFIEVTKLPEGERGKKYDELVERSRKQRADIFDVRTLLSRNLMPAVAKVAQSDSNFQAQLRCTVTGIAAERFRMANRRWPKTLDELVPRYMEKVENDPFTGTPLIYKPLPDGVVIYSVGKDLKDDGGDVIGKINREGLERGNYESNAPTDRGIRLWNPELRGK